MRYFVKGLIVPLLSGFIIVSLWLLSYPSTHATPQGSELLFLPIIENASIIKITPQPTTTSSPSNTPIPTLSPTHTEVATSIPSLTSTTTASPTQQATPSSTPSMTPTPSPQPSPTSQNAIINPGFEEGRYVGWIEHSSNNVHVVMHRDEDPNHQVFLGDWAAWLGGLDNETAYIRQNIHVPLTCNAFVVFYYETASTEPDCGNDIARIYINDDIVHNFPLCESTDTNIFRLESVSLEDYEGQDVTLKFEIRTDEINPSSLWVDDVGTLNCP